MIYKSPCQAPSYLQALIIHLKAFYKQLKGI